ncbi:hypothetical protein BDZ89DRAFT_1144462 [Hymenopellis radicata]|nr:hypothetical protein BDZ89DRAFT_1144462 [Hymenopellis radicata]
MTITHLQAQIDQVTLGSRVLRYRASSSHHHLHHRLSLSGSGAERAGDCHPPSYGDCHRLFLVRLAYSTCWMFAGGAEGRSGLRRWLAMLRDSLPDNNFRSHRGLSLADVLDVHRALAIAIRCYLAIARYTISLSCPSWRSWPPSLCASSNFWSCSQHMHD